MIFPTQGASFVHTTYVLCIDKQKVSLLIIGVIDLVKAEEDLYTAFHIILSPMEKLGLDSVQDYIDHIICKMREGGVL